MASMTFAGGLFIVTPLGVLGWETASAARTVIHPVLSRPYPDVTIRPGAPATGTFQLFFNELDDAQAAYDRHRDYPGPWVFEGAPDEPALVMPYVVAGGDVRLRIDTSGRASFVVEVPYQEVPAP